MAQQIPISDQQLADELVFVSGVGDRVRLAALDHVSLLATATLNRLRREKACSTVKYGQESPQVQRVDERLRIHAALATQIRAEIQRTETVPPKIEPDRLILHGRIVAADFIGHEGLTVSAVDEQGQTVGFTSTNVCGYFKLAFVPQDEDGAGDTRKLVLQVSDQKQAILLRADEAFSVTAGRVVFRELVVGEDRAQPAQPPPEPGPPTPTIIQPEDGTVTNVTTTKLSGVAAVDTTVEVFDERRSWGKVTPHADGTWSMTPQLGEGLHMLTATATDATNRRSAASARIRLTVDTVAPEPPSITATVEAATINTATPTLFGISEPNSTVELLENGDSLGTASTDERGHWFVTVELEDGTHVLTAKAMDAAGNVSDLSEPVQINVDTTVPQAPQITSPTSGTVTRDNKPKVKGTAEENTIVKVFAQETPLGTVTADANGNWTLTTPILDDGHHVLKARAQDKAGNVSPPSKSVEVRIDTTAPPGPVINTPADNTVTSDVRPTLIGTAEPQLTVEVFDRTTSLGTATVDSAGNWSFTTPKLNDGLHILTSIAADPAGNSSESSKAVRLTVRSQRLVDVIVVRMQQDERFERLEVSAERLATRFESLGIGTREQFAELLDRENPQLRGDLELPNLQSAQVFKQILKKVLEQLPADD